MTKQRHWKRVAYSWVAVGLIAVGVIALTGAGRREPARAEGAAAAKTPRGEITPGVARADVDTFDLQLD